MGIVRKLGSGYFGMEGAGGPANIEELTRIERIFEEARATIAEADASQGRSGGDSASPTVLRRRESVGA
jgi:hypothetical protein